MAFNIVSVVLLVLAIVFLVLCLVNYKTSNKGDKTDEEKTKAEKNYKFFFALFIALSIMCEVFILLAKKFMTA